MKIIRWFFSHIILVLLIVIVIYGYMFWGRLVDSDTPGGKAIAYLSHKFAPANEIDEQDIVAGLNAGEVSREKPADSAVTDVENTAVNNMDASRKAVVVNNELQPDELSPGESSIASQPSKVSVDNAPSTFENSADSAGTDKIHHDTFVSPDIVEQLNSPAAVSAAIDVDNTSSLTDRPGETSVNDTQLTIGEAITSAGESAVETIKDNLVSPDVEARLSKVDDTSEAVAASQPNTKVQSSDVKANWITARESYHKRNYELSEKSYQQVIDNTEDNYDAYGELGNVYFNQGKNAQAASAYYEAAAIFVRMGQSSRAESLMGLLWRLDPSKADELQKLIDSASS